MSDHKTTIAAYVTSGFAFLVGWALDNPSQAVAIVCAVFTAVVNWYYQRKRTQILSNIPFPKLQKEEL